jgi:hypothetical protein
LFEPFGAEFTRHAYINDTEKPTVSAPLNIVAGNNPNECFATVNPGMATASDNCPGATVNGVRSDAMALNAPYPVGTLHDDPCSNVKAASEKQKEIAAVFKIIGSSRGYWPG